MEKIKEKLHIGSSRRKSQPENDISSSNTTHSTTFNSGPGHAAPAGVAGTTGTTGAHGHHSGNTIEDTYEDRGSFDEELATMSPDERVAYLKEYDDSDKSGEPKKGGLIEKLIARGNKRTEEQLEREHAERTAGQTNLAGAATTAGSNPVIR